MATTTNLGDGTILTETSNKEDQIDKFIHLDIFTASFITGIILTVICIVYLFKSNTEYICWIFGLCLLVLLPITWLGNFVKSSTNKYKWYISFCLFFGIILNFTAVLMVILYTTRLNSRIKDYNANQVVEPGKKPLKYNINPDVLSNYQKIKILFTTNLVLCIAIIMNFFVYTGEQSKDPKKIEPIMASNMYWWYKKLQNTFIWIDEWITAFIGFFPIHSFLKMFFLFCGGFLFFFFSFFVKLKTTHKDDAISDEYIQNLIDEFGYGLRGVFPVNNFDIVNFPDILVETAGPVNFAALSSFFLSVCITLIIWFVYLLLKSAISSLYTKKSIEQKGGGIVSNIKSIPGNVLNTSGTVLKTSGQILGKSLTDSKDSLDYIRKSIPKIPNPRKINLNDTKQNIEDNINKKLNKIKENTTEYITNTKESIKKYDYTNNSFVTILFSIIFTINFVILFLTSSADKNTKNKNPTINVSSQNYILFCLCFLFSILGTPVVFMVFELLGRIFSFSLSGDLKATFFPNSTKNKCEGKKIFDCPNRRVFSIGLLISTFLGLLFGIYANGKTWMDNNGNNSRIKIFVITIMSIMVGWFFALHLKFNMISFVYESVIQPSRAVLFIFAPITVLGLAITQLAIAAISSKLVGNPIKTDG
jgi:hypothetical protein